MNQGRPIGRRIRQACEALEKVGPCGSGAVWAHMALPDLPLSNAGRYLLRAEFHGLVTVDRAKWGSWVYTINPKWRDLIDLRPDGRPKKKPTPKQAIKPRAIVPVSRGISSVFQLGERP